MFTPTKIYRHKSPTTPYDILIMGSRKLEGFYELKVKYLDKQTNYVISWPSGPEEEQIAIFESSALSWEELNVSTI